MPKSQTPLSDSLPRAISPIAVTFLGRLFSGLRLTDEQMRYWIDHTREMHEGLRFLQNPPMAPKTSKISLSASTMLEIGRYGRADLITRVGVVTYDCKLAMKEMSIAPQSELVQVVEVTPKILGMTEEYVQLWDFFRTASSFGYGLCPPEVGPYFFVDVPQTPQDSCISVAMETIPHGLNDRERWVFEILVKYDSRYLQVVNGRPHRIISRDCRWLFVDKTN